MSESRLQNFVHHYSARGHALSNYSRHAWQVRVDVAAGARPLQHTAGLEAQAASGTAAMLRCARAQSFSVPKPTLRPERGTFKKTSEHVCRHKIAQTGDNSGAALDGFNMQDR